MGFEDDKDVSATMDEDHFVAMKDGEACDYVCGNGSGGWECLATNDDVDWRPWRQLFSCENIDKILRDI